MRSFLKPFRDSADLTEEGRLFQRNGALTAKVQSPLDLRREWGINRRPRSEDLSGLEVMYEFQNVGRVMIT